MRLRLATVCQISCAEPDGCTLGGKQAIGWRTAFPGPVDRIQSITSNCTSVSHLIEFYHTMMVLLLLRWHHSEEVKPLLGVLALFSSNPDLTPRHLVQHPSNLKPRGEFPALTP